MNRARYLRTIPFVFAVWALPEVAYASPGQDPATAFIWNLIGYVATYVGPALLGLALVFAVCGWMFGMRDGLQRALVAGVGGVLLMSMTSVISLVQNMAGA